MMEIAQGEPVADFVGGICGAKFAQPYVAIGYSQDGEIIGGCVFNGYDGRNVDLSITHTGKSWLLL